nr:unnamed protein product [Callosobruchus chinensis]
MPRNYIKKRKNYGEQDVADAETEVREGKSSIREAAKKFKINATYLYRRLHNMHQGVQGRRTALSQSDEEALANSVKVMAKWGFPLTKDELKNVVCDYVTANGLKTVFKNNKPGNDWFANLLCKIWHEGITPETILTGFRSTGIYPPNRNKYPVSRIDPEKLHRYEENKRISNQCAPCPPNQPPQEAMLLDTSLPGTKSAQATISFESLLLDKVNKHPKPVPPTRRRIDGKGKVITAQEYLDAIKAKVESKINKVSKKSKENKAPSENHGSPKINRCKQLSKSKSKKTEDNSSDSDSTEEISDKSDDSDSVDIVPAPDYIQMFSVERLHKNDFILAKFRGGKRSSFIYRYVCYILNICDSGEIEVMGLISTSPDKDKFRKVVSDVSYITKEDVIGKLPLPDVADDIHIFCAPVDIHEQK